MKSLEKLKIALDGLEITDEQMSVLNDFFEEFRQAQEEQIRSEFNEEIESLKVQIQESQSGQAQEDLIPKSEVEEAFELARQDFMEKGERILELAREDMAVEYSEKLAHAINEVYETLEDKARQEFYESGEYADFKRVKDIMKGYVFSESEIAEELSKIDKERQQAIQENAELKRRDLINTLIKDLPEKRQAVAADFLENAQSEDDVLRNYDSLLRIWEADESQSTDTKEPEDVETALASEVDNDFEDEDETENEPIQESFFETETERSTRKPVGNKHTGFTDQEQLIMKRAGLG